MTNEEYIKKLECTQKIIAENRPLAIAASSIHAIRIERIFTDGRNTSGGQIGKYDTKRPMYINPLSAAGDTEGLNPPTGKTGRTKFESTGQPHKTTYVNNYKEYRNRIGKRIDTVNLTLYGDLRSNFSNNSRATKVSDNEYITGLDDANSKKAKGLTEKYGEFLKHSQEEIDKFYEIVGDEIKNEISKC